MSNRVMDGSILEALVKTTALFVRNICSICYSSASHWQLQSLISRTLVFLTSGLLALMATGSSAMFSKAEHRIAAELQLEECFSSDQSGPPQANQNSVGTITSQSIQDLSGKVYYVSNSGRDRNSGDASSPFQTIQTAIDKANPGDAIYICSGHYDAIVIDGKRGTASQPILVAAYPGHEQAVSISTATYDRGAAIKIKESAYIVIRGLKATKSLWGIYVTNSHNVTLSSNIVDNIGQEAIRFREDSSYGEIVNNTISNTGQRKGFSQYGEGIYLGAGRPNYPGEAASEILIRGNEISHTTAEAIDIKSFVHNVVVEENIIHDINTARSGAIVVGINATDESDFTNSDNVVIRNNTIQNISRTSQWLDGNAIKVQSSATIQGNKISNYQHRGIFVENARSDNSFRIYDNQLCRRDDSGSHGDIVVSETDAHVALGNNTVRHVSNQ